MYLKKILLFLMNDFGNNDKTNIAVNCDLSSSEAISKRRSEDA